MLFSVPGAFTPTCDAKHLPGFVELADRIKAKGVDTIACTAVNDVFVMNAWGKSGGVGDKILMLADGNGEYVKALGLELNATGFGMGMRGQRFAIIVKDGVATQVHVEAPGEFKVSAADFILKQLIGAPSSRTLLALRTSPPVFTVAEAERIARDTYGLAASISPLPGERDCNFHLRTADRHEYVLKIVDLEASPQATDCQIRVLRHVAEQDPTLPVPRVFATARARTSAACERRRRHLLDLPHGLSAGQLLRAPSAVPLLSPTWAKRSRGSIGRCRDFSIRRWRSASHGTCGGFRSSSSFRPTSNPRPCAMPLRACPRALKERMPALRALRSQAIHGDCHGHNLLVDAEASAISGILDFGDMIHAPLVLGARGGDVGDAHR